MKVIGLIILLIAVTGLFAQKKFDYQPIKCKGEIPYSIRTLAKDKYEEDKVQHIRDHGFNNEDANRFYLKSNYFIDDLLISGYLYYGDEITTYLNRIADSLLADKPEIRDKIEIYTSKSPVLNAFSTDKGVIIFNLGLIARAENEAQIAFIMAHELAHFERKHNIDKYAKTEKTFRDNPNTLAENGKNLLELAVYSQEKEFEADSLAFVSYYKHSGYSKDIILSFFDLLERSYLPFEDFDYAAEFFKINNYRFDTNFVEQFNEKFENSDTMGLASGKYSALKTHPSIKDRFGALERIAEEAEGGKLFLQSEEVFNNIRNLARYEMSRQYYSNGDYCNAITNSLILLKKDPESEYLQAIIAASLYTLAKYQEEKEISYYYKFKNYHNRNYTYILYALGRLQDEEMTLFALDYMKSVKARYPGNDFLNRAFTDLLEQVIEEEIFSEQDSFLLMPIAKNGMDKLRGDTMFWLQMDNIRDSLSVESGNQLSKKEKRKSKRFHKKFGYALSMDSITIINPFYYKIDDRDKDKIQYVNSEKKEQKLLKLVDEYSSKLDLHVNLLAPKIMGADETNRFNEYAMCMDWVREKFTNDPDLELITYNTIYLKDLPTEHIALMGGMNIRMKKDYPSIFLFVGAGYTIPYALYLLIRPEYQSLYYYFIFNSRTGEVAFTKAKQARTGDYREDFLHSIVYNSLNQTKRKTFK